MIAHSRSARRTLALLAGLMAAGCSSGAEVPMAVPAAEAAFLRENDAAMAAMMAGMEVAPTGDIDRDFARMMIPHHRGAVAMAKVFLKYGKNAELRALAARIVDAQEEEIALMTRVAGDAPPADNPKSAGGMAHDHHAR